MKQLTAAEAAIYESLVVKRYMQPFGEAAVPMLITHSPAVVAQLDCRTGYPAELIKRHLADAVIFGVDSSPAALELARTKAQLAGLTAVEYQVAAGWPTGLLASSFTHALALHPLGDDGHYEPLFREMYRLLATGGQAVVALPLRGSFPEIYDMLREYALRHEQPQFGEAVDRAAGRRPNPETLAEQVERAGFVDVEVTVDLVGITFENGRDFLEDPITRLVVGPDIVASFSSEKVFDAGLAYATEAIAKYWSEISFELTVNIGCVSARKP
jgi:ubiquinone/menaquinone biosynthesis C-methylase UbiE